MNVEPIMKRKLDRVTNGQNAKVASSIVTSASLPQLSPDEIRNQALNPNELRPLVSYDWSNDLTVWNTRINRSAEVIVVLMSHAREMQGAETPTKQGRLIDPEFIIGSVVEDGIDSINEITSIMLNKATIDVYFENVYTPIIRGNYLWEQLPGESASFYKAFVQYRDARWRPGSGGLRSISKIAGSLGVSPKFLYSLSKIFYWSDRVIAYDIYKRNTVIENAKANSLIVLGEQRDLARRLRVRCEEILEEQLDAELVEPKDVLKYLQFSVALERISTGLSKDKPGLTPEEAKATETPAHGGSQAAAGINLINVNMGTPSKSKAQEIFSILSEAGAMEVIADEKAQA